MIAVKVRLWDEAAQDPRPPDHQGFAHYRPVLDRIVARCGS